MKRKKQKQYTITTATIIGVFVSVILVVIYTSMASALMISGRLTERVLQFLEPGIIILALYIGTIIAFGQMAQGYLLVSGMIAVCYTAFTLAANIIVFDGTFHAVWVEIFSVLIGSGLGCFTKVKTVGKKKHHHKYC